MISAMFNGISGLDSFQKALNVQSNNISNINTVAHKTDRITFTDLMYQQGIGKGTAAPIVQKNFVQGSLKITDNPYDLAVDGKGYFVVYDQINEETYYSRAGDLKQDVDGYLKTSTGMFVQGIPAAIQGNMIINDEFPSFVASQIVKTADNVQSINVKASNYNQSATDDIDTGSGIIVKKSSAKISDIETLRAQYREELKAHANNPLNVGTASTPQQTEILFEDYDLTFTSNNYASIYVDNVKYTQYFETDAPTTMKLLAAQIASSTGIKDASFDETTETMTINGLVPGKDVNIHTPVVNTTEYLTISTTPAVKGSGTESLNSVYAALEEAVQSAGAQLEQIRTDIAIPPKGTATINEFANVDAYEDMQLNLTALGISDNQFSSFLVEDGIIYMTQDDNKYAIGKIPTVAFRNEAGLVPEGGKLYKATRDAGEPINADYGSKIIGGALELSNSNMSDSLVDLMTYQRAYEANSKSITTSDEFLNIAIQLKK
jgi:flagellar hook protein FlgE